MKYKKLIQILGFKPKENSSGVFQKKYSKFNDYTIEVDFEKELIFFGNDISSESKTTQNFSQAENWVILECVDRLIEKGYSPGNITLEKTWKTGHGTSGRLDILVTRDDHSAYLMIECKVWGADFEKEFKNLKKNGGQLFTYFQQDKDADILMLYSSELDGKEIKFRNEIVKIEEDYRQAGNVKDFYERWNKLPKANGFFDDWVSTYEFQSKALTKKDLKALKQEDSSFIFNRFLEILRHNVVSDKPNAFNKIFTLFLCKIVDENRNVNEQLHFQWIEGEDNHVSFQKRLTDLYNRGMLELLEKKVTDVSDSEFDKQFLQVEDQYKSRFKEILTEIRLKKNNEFAIKEVYDDVSFEENAKVVKEVVELLQVYQIRYNYRQQFLSDFFELLLTTGLKQESGQFFTPVPVARFIIKSLPLRSITDKKVAHGNKNDLLPRIIDYAAGSGHFITESMEELQKYMEVIDMSSFNPSTKRAIKKWQEDQFDWAEDYVYAIEKDYRLVKTAKVSCYLHGDGLAKIIHGDGLGDFTSSKEFKGLLLETDKNYPQDNKQFDVIISNPPYSVSAFKGSMIPEEKAKKAFDLYSRLTDQSSEIECLFIERTKQLLKDGGVAGIVLPSSILNNSGIYTHTREIILKYFEIVAMAEMGSGTFMATGTNTVTLFLRRRNNADAFNIEEAVKRFFSTLKELTINGIEKPIQKYISHVWKNISFEDYISLLKKEPTPEIKKNQLFIEYQKKTKAKNEQEDWDEILKYEKEKLLYFIITYPQKIVLVKTGTKNEEKKFLGYEFSNRRGSEGIHPVLRGKSIDDCTQLYDPESLLNAEKANTYIYSAFTDNKFDLPIPENLQKNVSYHDLVDMLIFDNADFDKSITLSVKKKHDIKSSWKTANLGELIEELPKSKIKVGAAKDDTSGKYPFFTSGESVLTYSDYLVENNNIYLSTGGNAIVKIYEGRAAYSTDTFVIRSKEENIIRTRYIFYFLENILDFINEHQFKGVGLKHLQKPGFRNIEIPLPPIEIQDEIISEIGDLENKRKMDYEKIEKLNEEINSIFNQLKAPQVSLGTISTFKNGLNFSRKSTGASTRIVGVKDFKDNFTPNLKELNQIQIDGKLNESYCLRSKDLLVVRSNGSANLVGRFLLIDDLDEKTSFSGFTIRIRPDLKVVNAKFLCHYLRTESVRNKITKDSKGSNIKSLNQGLLHRIKVPLPAVLEQQELVSEIEEIEKKIIFLKDRIQSISDKKKWALENKIMKRESNSIPAQDTVQEKMISTPV